MGLAVRAQHAEQLRPGLFKVFHDEFTDQPLQWPMLLNKETSGRNFEEILELSGLSAIPEKPEGDSVVFDTPVEGNKVRYTMKSFAGGFQATHELISDDQYGKIKNMSSKLGLAARQTQEVRSANVLNTGFGTSLFSTFDGLALFDAAHVELKSLATYSNVQTTPSDLGPTGVKSMLILLRKQKNTEGFPIVQSPNLLVVPVDLEWDAKQTLTPGNEPGTANLQDNVIATNHTGLKTFVSDYLTSTTAWFMQARRHYATFFMREDMSFDASDDFLTRNALFQVFMRFQVGVHDPRGWVGSQGL